MARNRLVCPDPSCSWWVSTVLTDGQCALLLAAHQADAHRPRPVLLPEHSCIGHCGTKHCDCDRCGSLPPAASFPTVAAGRASTSVTFGPGDVVTLTIGPAHPDVVRALARAFGGSDGAS